MRRLYAVLFAVLLAAPAYCQEVYLLGPGDKIEIKVFGHDDLTVQTLLGNSGKVNYPFLGEIQITGLTLNQVESVIVNGLKGDYLISPNVYAHILEYRPFYIHGEVEKPGGYPYQPGMTLNQAIALSGGLTERASVEKILLYREANPTRAVTATLNTKLFAGDTIIIEQRFF